MTDHVDLRDGWKMWRRMWVRAPGFPARGVLALAALDVAAAADALASLDQAAAASREQVVAALRELQGSAKATRRVIDQLRRGRVVAEDRALEERVPALLALRELEGARARQRDELDRAFSAELARTAAAVRATAVDPRFREAMLWQNRGAVHTGVDWLLAHPEATNTSARQKQYLIANYLQRYSVKNDTIGFFGPICWGEVRDSDALDVRPGHRLLEQRAVHFEHWAIDALASALGSWPELKPFIAPRRVPTASIDGTTLRYGFDRTTEVPPVVARLLAACDGDTLACTIARALVADRSLELDDESEVYELIEQLAGRKLLTWTLEPTALVHPERELRRLLERIEVPELRARALDELARLEVARADVAAAAGDPRRLAVALEALDTTFSAATGQAAARRAGETYAARTPIYEDCVRDLSIVVGRPILDRLAPACALVAQSARWFTHELATRYRAALRERHAVLARETRGPVTYLRFFRAIESLLPEQRNPGEIGSAVVAELERRWSGILDVDLTARRVDLNAADLADPVARAFSAPGPGWPSARHVSPDVLIAARSVDAIRRGEYTAVLGEVHIGNTLLARFLIPHGPDRGDSLRAVYLQDVPQVRVLPVEARHRVTRADAVSSAPDDVDLEVTGRSWRARGRALRVADLVVEEVDADLRLCDLRTGHRFDVSTFFEAYLHVMVGNHFQPVPRGPHVPRISVDGVVLGREQWRFEPAELTAFSGEARGPQQFAAVRTWARAAGLPRWCFFKIPEEPKPVFVDFASPLYVEMFAKLVRKASALMVSEMLPTIEDAWIPDAEGNLYTGELRMVLVDPAKASM